MEIEQVTIIVLMLIIVGLLYSYGLPQIKTDDIVISNITEAKIVETCKSSNITDTMNCVENVINPIFKFNYTNDSLNLTLEELIGRGGDCKDWGELIINLSNQFNYTTETKYFPMENLNGKPQVHMVVLMYDTTGYCMASLNNIDCYGYTEVKK